MQSSEGYAADQRRLWWACKGVQALAPPGSWKKIWEEEVLSLSICLFTHFSHTTETLTLLRIKCEWYIFIKKCVRSFIEVHKLFDYVSACICIMARQQRSSTSRGSGPAGLCWSLAHFVQCGSDDPSWSWTQIWVQAHMPDYSLNCS